MAAAHLMFTLLSNSLSTFSLHRLIQEKEKLNMEGDEKKSLHII